MDPFYTPFEQQPNIPGGMLGQYAFSQFLNAAVSGGYISDPYYTGGTDPYTAMKGYGYDARQASILEQATMADATLFANAGAGLFRMGGRQVSPELMNAITGGTGILTPVAAMLAAQSQQGRQALSVLSGGVSSINVGLGVANLTRKMRDPISGGFGVGVSGAQEITSAVTQSLRERSYGFTDLDNAQIMAGMARRGELPTGGGLLDSAANEYVQAALDRGDLTTRQLMEAGKDNSAISRILIADGYAQPEDFYRPADKALLDLRAEGIAGGENVDLFLADEQEQQRLLKTYKETALNEAVLRDQTAADRILGSTESRRARRQGATAKDIQDAEAALLEADSDIDLADTLERSQLGTGFGVLNRANARYDAALKQYDAVGGRFDDVNTMSDNEFDSRALEFAAAAGSKLGVLSPEIASDLATSLEAARNNDANLMATTTFGQLSRDEKLGYLSEITGQGAVDIGYAISGNTADEMREQRVGRTDENDPFGIAEIEQIANDLKTNSAGKKIIENTKAKEIAIAAEEQRKVLASVRDFFTSKELKEMGENAVQIATDMALQMSGGAVANMTGHKLQSHINTINASADRLGFSRDQVLAISAVSNQAAQEAGFEREASLTFQQQTMRSASTYRDMEVGALGRLGYDVYGMSSMEEIANLDREVLTDVRKSEDAAFVAAISMLSRNAGVEVEKGSATEALLQDAEAGLYGEKSQEMLDLNYDQRMELALAGMKGVSRDDVIRTMSQERAIQMELDKNRGIIDAGMDRAQSKSFDELGISVAGAGMLLARKSNITNREDQLAFSSNISRSLTASLDTFDGRTAQDDSAQGVMAASQASQILEEIEARAADGSAGDRAFLDQYTTREEQLSALQNTIAEGYRQVYEDTGKRVGDHVINRGRNARRTGRTAMSRDEAEGYAKTIIQARDGDWRHDFVKRLEELGKEEGGSGMTSIEVLSASMDLDVTGKSRQELEALQQQVAIAEEVYQRQLDELSPDAEGARQILMERQDAFQNIDKKIADTLKEGPATNQNIDAYVMQAAERQEAIAAAAASPVSPNAPPGSGSATGDPSSPISNVVDKIAQVINATIENIDMSGVTINLNGKPIVQNASGTATPSRAGMSAVPGS